MYSTDNSNGKPEECSFSVENDAAKRSTDKKDRLMNPETARFPFCIVWTTLPLLSQLIPIIGHTGICDSEGVIHDFAGPYTVNEDDFAFGKTLKFRMNKNLYNYLRYVKLENKIYSDQEWDESLRRADEKYRGMMVIK